MAPRIAFVSGGGSGLGKATVLTLLEDGWSVAFTYFRSVEGAKAIVAAAEEAGSEAMPIRADLLHQDEAQDAAQEAVAHFGHVDALVHNFGPFVFERKTLAEYSDEDFEQMLTGNLRSFWWLYRTVVPGMRERQFGRIVTLGSEGAGLAVGWGGRAPYAAAKAGLASLTRSVAREERKHGITANMVCPGDVRGRKKELIYSTGLRPDEAPQVGQSAGEASASSIASGHAQSAIGGDVARVVTFYCQPSSQQLNGTVTEVNGGADIRFTDEYS